MACLCLHSAKSLRTLLSLSEHWVFLFLCSSRQDRKILISLLKMVLNSGIFEVGIV